MLWLCVLGLIQTSFALIAPVRTSTFFSNTPRSFHPPAYMGSLISQCEEKWFDQVIDHFGFDLSSTFKQRYFVCSEYWKPGGPIFFYTGNEADVTLYLNSTGLMWETAPKLSALLVFAEHRYFGESLPFGSETPKKMNYLSSSQALADYATLIKFLKEDLKSQESAVIAFGGSYGGMLSSWFRMKYPNSVDGAIAASAPILAFKDMVPPYNYNSFANIETDDATPACQDGVRKVWPLIQKMASSASGRSQLSSIFRTCTPLSSPSEAMGLFDWLSSAIAFLTMGNYPYPTAYITNGGCVLPSYPMNVSCLAWNSGGNTPEQILANARDMAAVFYNCSKNLPCFNLTQSVNNETAQDGLFWEYLFCTEMMMPSTQNGVTDMFWATSWNWTAAIEGCQQQWGVTSRPEWPAIQYGGPNMEAFSNIFFSNGRLDPWHGGGVLNSNNPNVPTFMIDGAAHHLDLFFSNAKDPASVTQCRQLEVSFIKKWVQRADEKRKKRVEL